jgi:hypothetical protein
MAYAVWFGLFENRGECHFNVINYAVQNPTVNIMKDFRMKACYNFATNQNEDAKSNEWSFIRFEQLKDGIYFAKIDPDFDVWRCKKHFKTDIKIKMDHLWFTTKIWSVLWFKRMEIITMDLDLKSLDDKAIRFSQILKSTIKNCGEYFDHTNIKQKH